MSVCWLTGLNQAASGAPSPSLCEVQEEEQEEASPFGRLATRLGLPANCDIDLRKQEELEVTVKFCLHYYSKSFVLESHRNMFFFKLTVVLFYILDPHQILVI